VAGSGPNQEEVVSIVVKREHEARVNERIRVPQVRVIGADGEQIGILPTRDALLRAREIGLDLVEVSPNSAPPVCRIMDFGRYKYEQSKKARKARKRQHAMQVKEVKLRPKIEDHDYTFKVGNARKFLERHDKVKFTVTFRGRELAHVDLGRKILDRVVADLIDIGQIESAQKMEGRNLVLLMIPKAARANP
jgi:translation initiation factor IF-3